MANEIKAVPDHDRTRPQEEVGVSVNRVGMACGEAAKRTGLNGKYSSTMFRLFIYHGDLGGWNFGVGDLFPSRHWFLEVKFRFSLLAILRSFRKQFS